MRKPSKKALEQQFAGRRQYRHGDVLLYERPIPEGAEVVKNPIVAEGNQGHHHRMTGDHQVLRSGNSLFVQVGTKGASITHEEHGPIKLPVSTFAVVRQREWAPEGPRMVVD